MSKYVPRVFCGAENQIVGAMSRAWDEKKPDVRAHMNVPQQVFGHPGNGMIAFMWVKGRDTFVGGPRFSKRRVQKLCANGGGYDDSAEVEQEPAAILSAEVAISLETQRRAGATRVTGSVSTTRYEPDEAIPLQFDVEKLIVCGEDRVLSAGYVTPRAFFATGNPFVPAPTPQSTIRLDRDFIGDESCPPPEGAGNLEHTKGKSETYSHLADYLHFMENHK
jgi:hypothetical protein